MVRTAMAERELERVEPECEPEQLMAEADAEERRAAEQGANGLDRPLEHGWVSVAGDDGDLDTGRGEPLRDGALTTEVYQHYPRAGADEDRLADPDVPV